MQSPKNITALFLLLLLGVSSFVYYPKYVAQKTTSVQLQAMLSNDQNLPLLATRIKTSNCIVQNNSPDSACTPGAVFESVTIEEMCVAGYTKTVRNVSDKLRKEVFAEYGISYPQPRGSYEVDHLIPLAIGGDNEIANLFPQPAAPQPGFREKDLVEVFLREEVCVGRADLAAAQRRIATDWLSIYEKLPPEKISELKSKYHNWSN